MRQKKLNYEDPSVDSVVIGRVWIELMDQQETSTEDLLAAVKMGERGMDTIHPFVWHSMYPFSFKGGLLLVLSTFHITAFPFYCKKSN